MLPTSMKAVVCKAPFEVVVEQRPVPKILDPRDAILKVLISGLCGSDLHPYRGHGTGLYDFVLGHECVGEIVELGAEVKGWELGERVIAPFSMSCGSCFYCLRGYTARCPHAKAYGGPGIDGCQAEYFRLPFAGTTLIRLSDAGDLPPEMMLLMTDIFPTGFSTAMNARRLADEGMEPRTADGLLPGGDPGRKGVCVVVGCGPVGLCAITCATHLFSQVFATDLHPARLLLAEKHGATALPFAALQTAIHGATDGRGADAVLECVGHPTALVQAMGLARPYGAVSSCGVHTREIGVDGGMLYDKNLRLQFGRCSVRTHFAPALAILRQHKDLFASFVEHRIPLDQAPEYYKLFEAGKVAKTIFMVAP